MSTETNLENLGFEANLKEVSRVGQFTLLRIEPKIVSPPNPPLKKKPIKKVTSFI